MLVSSLLAAVLAGVAGYWLRQRFGFGTVEASAWIALISGVALPLIFEHGVYLAAVCTSVSYAGMSSFERAGSYLEMVAISVICAIAMDFGQECLVGVGGRLGTIGALSVLAFCGMKFVYREMRHLLDRSKPDISAGT